MSIAANTRDSVAPLYQHCWYCKEGCHSYQKCLSFVIFIVVAVGFSTLWLNLALPNLPNTMHGYQAGLRSGQEVTPWLREYTIGCVLVVDCVFEDVIGLSKPLGAKFIQISLCISQRDKGYPKENLDFDVCGYRCMCSFHLRWSTYVFLGPTSSLMACS